MRYILLLFLAVSAFAQNYTFVAPTDGSVSAFEFYGGSSTPSPVGDDPFDGGVGDGAWVDFGAMLVHGSWQWYGGVGVPEGLGGGLTAVNFWNGTGSPVGPVASTTSFVMPAGGPLVSGYYVVNGDGSVTSVGNFSSALGPGSYGAFTFVNGVEPLTPAGPVGPSPSDPTLILSGSSWFGPAVALFIMACGLGAAVLFIRGGLRGKA